MFFLVFLETLNSIKCTKRGSGVMLLNQNDIFHSEPCMEMSSERTRESISTTSTIYEFMHLGGTGGKKRQCGTSSTSDENPAVIQQGGSGWERVFKIKLL